MVLQYMTYKPQLLSEVSCDLGKEVLIAADLPIWAEHPLHGLWGLLPEAATMSIVSREWVPGLKLCPREVCAVNLVTSGSGLVDASCHNWRSGQIHLRRLPAEDACVGQGDSMSGRGLAGPQTPGQVQLQGEACGSLQPETGSPRACCSMGCVHMDRPGPFGQGQPPGQSRPGFLHFSWSSRGELCHSWHFQS